MLGMGGNFNLQHVYLVGVYVVVFARKFFGSKCASST